MSFSTDKVAWNSVFFLMNRKISENYVTKGYWQYIFSESKK